MAPVPGLDRAIKLYSSDKVRDRAQGSEALREIFSNRHNLEVFANTAGQDNGTGWVALFQVLFPVVILERKAVNRKTGGAAAEKRLSDAVSLVRYVTERSVRFITRRPFLTLFTHLTSSLVGDGGCISGAVAIDYAKAIQTLLSFPAHLENLDHGGWRALMGVCWAALLGDRVTLDEDEAWAEDGNDGDEDMGDDSRRVISASVATELLTIIRILLSSSRAPLISSPPHVDETTVTQSSLGFVILCKINRYLTQLPSQTTVPLDILRSLNLVLTELELNARGEFTSASLKLFPQLVAVWTNRNKGDFSLRENALVSLRIMLPFVTHPTIADIDSKDAIREAMAKIIDWLGKEAGSRNAIRPIELNTLRFDCGGEQESSNGPFHLAGVMAGFGFDATQALNWAAVELYADCCYQTSDSFAPTPTPQTQRRKRQRTENSLDKLLSLVSTAQLQTRQLACQVLVFLIGKHRTTLPVESRLAIRSKLLEMLDDNDSVIQSWSFIGLSSFATMEDSTSDDALHHTVPATPSAPAFRRNEQPAWNRLWTHAIRKTSVKGVSRAACHAATVMLRTGKVDHARCPADMHAFLKNVELHGLGPASVTDASAAFLSSCIHFVRADVGLYSANLEDKVVDWFARAFRETQHGRTSRISSATPSNVLDLLSSICHFTGSGVPDVTVLEHLPDSPAVNHILQEAKTAPIRNSILYGTIPSLPLPEPSAQAALADTQCGTTVESLNFLESRPRKLNGILRAALESAQEEWVTIDERATTGRPTLRTYERLRKGVDLVVIVLAFQATIQSNGYRPDSDGCLQPAATLLETLIPHLLTFSDQVAHQHLVWRGFMPLYYRASGQSETWPIMLKPDASSGIRPSVLPPTKYASYNPEDGEPKVHPRDELLRIIWGREEVHGVLGQVIEVSQAMLRNVCSPSSGDEAAPDALDDDEFGPILTGDGDGMTQSSEAREAHRSTESLIETLVAIRLRGSQLASPHMHPVKDTKLLNVFLSAERDRFDQLGFVICDAIQENTLRLTATAINYILSELYRRLSLYIFKRDGELIRLALVFLGRSIKFWLSPDSGFTCQAIELARALVEMGEGGKVSYWPARLQLLLFIEEYLEYDPAYATWSQFNDTDQADMELGGDHSMWGPLYYVLQATGDVDSRVRFRAVTSSASIHYLPELPADQKQQAYFDVLNRQSLVAYNWDHYLTNVLWKLNTCVASSQLRSATMFHLYEVADFQQSFLNHLQPGLEAVAQRLGLDSLKPLFRAHATIVITNQLHCGQLPLNLPCSLYGCASRTEFAQLCVETVGPTLLANPSTSIYMTFFTAVCQAALVHEEQAHETYLPSAAAIAVTMALQQLESATPDQVTQTGSAVLAALPPPSNKLPVKRLLKARIEFIIVSLIGLTDLSLTNEALADILSSIGQGTAGDIFRLLLEYDTDTNDSAAVLNPSAPVTDVLQAHGLFRSQFSGMDKRRMVFDGIIRLFYSLNDTYFVNEQQRYLRAIALLISLYPEQFSHGIILQHFLSNVIDLLPLDNIGGVAMSMLEWGFDKVESSKPAPDLVDIFANLSSVHAKLQAEPHLEPLSQRLSSWIASKARSWGRKPVTEYALDAALVFWPEEWTAHFPRGLDFHYDTVAAIAERPTIQNPMALCRRLEKIANEKDPSERETFLHSTFWYLKKALTTSQWDGDGAMAFINLMYKAGGTIHTPALQTIRGLTGRSEKEDKTFSQNPELGLRVLVMGKLVEQSTTDNFRLRTTTFEVLQSSLPFLQAMLDDSPVLVPNRLRDLLVYLVPNTTVSPEQPVDLSVLGGDGSSSSWVCKSRVHQVWAKELALMLGSLAAKDDPFYACLRPLLVSYGNAAVELLPYLVQAVLTCGSTVHEQETENRAAALTNHFTQVLQFPDAATETLDTIMNIILHLRRFKPPYGHGELSYNHWLAIDPIVMSEAAGKCGAYASSLLFLEMANDRDDTEGDANLDLSAPRIQKIMYDIYSNVEDPDGFYGIQNDDVMDSLLRRLDHEEQPVKSLGYKLAKFEAAPSGNADSLVSSLRNLHDLGFDSFAGNFLKVKLSEGATELSHDPLFLELAWRMGDWDVPTTQDQTDTTYGRFYSALRAVHRERSRDIARTVVDDTIRKELGRLQEIGVECMTEIKAATTNLLCLRDIARWTSPAMQTAIDQSDFDGPLLTSFVDLSASFDFSTAERISATRLSLIRSARARESKNLLGDLVSSQLEGLVKLETACQLRLCELARKEGNLQAAVNAVIAVRQLEEGHQSSDAGQDEFCQVLWAQGHHSLAIQHINSLTRKLNPVKDGKRQAILMGRSAHWTALANLKAAEEIRRTFRGALDQAGELDAANVDKAQIAFAFAAWADSYYATLSQSPELVRLKSLVMRKSEAFRRLDASSRSPSGSPRRTPAQSELEEERSSKRKMEAEVARYLEYALTSYAIALSLCDDYDDCITRLCSLWLEHDTNENLNKTFGTKLPHISSHKFIVLAPQLAARLAEPQTAFNSALNNLMLRLAQDHPYHVLYQVITLAAGAKLPTPTSSSRSRTAPTQTQSSTVDGRNAAAAEIKGRLASDKERPLASRASLGMTKFAQAAVDWAQYCHNRRDTAKPGKRTNVPSSCSLLQCRNLPIPVATVVPPIDLTLQYADVPTISHYESVFWAAGGLHKPAVMDVVDTNGVKHVQLFKAEDEVRQDAVMEQVFDMTNRLLRRDRKTNVRNLTFRTYTVVPLYSKVGVIEFVGNTVAIGDWLKSAHNRYRKGIDVSQDVVRKNLVTIQEVNHTSDKLVSVYEKMMSNFQPVMRHFFTEKRREPLAWFSMRLNYARSVAVASMVGYMVGLGDRHCSNILIDTITGELVHIDFGIVFEEGRKLRIPEKVPFRLTSDTVDGLGITGVNGTFRQCAEHTLRVLRDSSDLILTVLEVFKHDPLYAWTSDPSKMRRAQGGGTIDPTTEDQARGQDKAERVLARIKQKLGRQLSVEYAVNMLIQEARDPVHLAKIYVGWQSWL